MYRINYDEEADVLYITLKDTSNSYAEDYDDDYIVLRDKDTKKITGITLLDFEFMRGVERC